MFFNNKKPVNTFFLFKYQNSTPVLYIIPCRIKQCFSSPVCHNLRDITWKKAAKNDVHLTNSLQMIQCLYTDLFLCKSMMILQVVGLVFPSVMLQLPQSNSIHALVVAAQRERTILNLRVCVSSFQHPLYPLQQI